MLTLSLGFFNDLDLFIFNNILIVDILFLWIWLKKFMYKIIIKIDKYSFENNDIILWIYIILIFLFEPFFNKIFYARRRKKQIYF